VIKALSPSPSYDEERRRERKRRLQGMKIRFAEKGGDERGRGRSKLFL